MKLLTELAQETMRNHVVEGDYVIDATVGNGHDTVFLAEQVGDSGKVFAFDNQQVAIKTSSNKLSEQGISNRVELFCYGHEHVADLIPELYQGKITAAMFNLGYLPGGDKAHTTNLDTSIRALEQIYKFLRPGGCLSVICYTGHSGGKEEANAVISWSKAQKVSDIRLEIPMSMSNPPHWLWMVK